MFSNWMGDRNMGGKEHVATLRVYVLYTGILGGSARLSERMQYATRKLQNKGFLKEGKGSGQYI